MASSFKSTSRSRPTSARSDITPMLPRSRENASFGSQDSGSTKRRYVLKELTEIPTAVRVCSGNYRTYSGQCISKDTKLYLHRKVQREVVQMRCLFPRNTRIVNLPLSASVQVGFEHPTSNFKNVQQVVKEDKNLPKVLFVVRSCQCSPPHDISESDVLIVTGLTQKKQLIVLNKNSQTIYHLSPKCKASFTTDPKQACIELKDLKFLDKSSLPWENVIPKGSVRAFGSPQKNQSVSIANILIEDCAIVQTGGQTEKHLIPLDAALEVEVIRLSVSSECEFPKDTYESIDSDLDLVNQPTVMDFPRRGSRSHLSESSMDGFRPSSAMSGVSSIDSFRPPSAMSGVSGVSGESSIASSRSSHFSKAESPSHRMPPVVEGSPGLVLNLSTILHETREVTRVFTLGLKLGIPEYILEGMDIDFPHNLERRKTALFSYWLRTTVNVSWRDITTALQEMGENRVSKRIACKNNYYSADPSEETEILHAYHDVQVSRMSEEQEIKENFKKLDEELNNMRKELQHIENLSIFQTQEGSIHYRSLFDMEKKIKLVEISLQTYQLDIYRLRLTSDEQTQGNRSRTSSMHRDKITMKVESGSQTYYNAVPLKQHQYVSKLWVSERDIARVEMQEIIARRDVLESGKMSCEKKLSELTASTAGSQDMDNRNILEECYSVRLMLNIACYKHKLIDLKVQEDELKQKMENIDEEMKAEMAYLRKQEAKSDLIPLNLLRHPTPPMYSSDEEETRWNPITKTKNVTGRKEYLRRNMGQQQVTASSSYERLPQISQTLPGQYHQPRNSTPDFSHRRQTLLSIHQPKPLPTTGSYERLLQISQTLSRQHHQPRNRTPDFSHRGHTVSSKYQPKPTH